jgi:hypothetical protein
MAKTRTGKGTSMAVSSDTTDRLRDHARLPSALPLAGATFAIPSLHDRKLLPLAEPLVAAAPADRSDPGRAVYAHTRRAPTWAQR